MIPDPTTNTNAKRKVMIATAPSRTSTRWKNTEMTYEDFVAKVSVTTRTRETLVEYRSMSKPQRDNIKDVGGFVAGGLKGGRRKVDTVMNRTMVTLDLDDVSTSVENVWEKITGAYQCELLIYPTHSHRPERPRLRLIIPLDTPVYPDQYQAIARRIADDIGIDWFDDTTYQPSRLMYWPSSSIDADYDSVFRRQRGEWLDPQQVLDTYLDWNDASFWPTSSRESVNIERAIKKQEDPLEKKNLVGAFCRAYTITEAIQAFLSEVYEPTEKDNRYTYKEGSTVGGLVVYEDKFAFSHHGTDPSSGELCNAFDLVRLHKFHEADENVKSGTPVVKFPSYIKMSELASTDINVKRLIGEEKFAEMEEDFDFEDGEEKPSTDWFVELVSLDNKGNVLETIDNVAVIIENDPLLKGRLMNDDFASRKVVVGSLPWNKVEGKGTRDWHDSDDDGLMRYLENHYNLTKAAVIQRGLGNAFLDQSFHPVRDYLHGLPEWDGVERLESLLIDYLGAEDTAYTRTVTKTHLVAAIARVMRPGVKYDTMITLTGPQGIGKSTFIRYLSDPWYSDSIDTVRGKEAYEALQGYWFIELGELSAFKKAEKEAVKGFLSKTEDVFRPAYGKYTVRFPRQCIFWGSTNDKLFLRDKTGDRRTWPVECSVQIAIKDIFTELRKERDQIWAEALKAYEGGWKLNLTPDMEIVARDMQQEFTEEDPRKDMIVEFLEKDIPVNWSDMSLHERRNWLNGESAFDNVASDRLMPRDKITAIEIWCECFERDKTDMRQPDAASINEILGYLPGWKKNKNPVRLGDAYSNERKRGFIRE